VEAPTMNPLTQLTYLTYWPHLTDLTRFASQSKSASVFTPRWISRKASSGVLFFWGRKRAS
jgi:hypothetical protein